MPLSSDGQIRKSLSVGDNSELLPSDAPDKATSHTSQTVDTRQRFGQRELKNATRSDSSCCVSVNPNRVS
jgi:hypothetical protein